MSSDAIEFLNAKSRAREKPLLAGQCYAFKNRRKDCYVNIVCDRLQNSPQFCVFKYARAVKQKVWNEAQNRERDWGESLARVRLLRLILRHALPTSSLILRKETDCFAVYRLNNIAPLISCCFLFTGGSREVT